MPRNWKHRTHLWDETKWRPVCMANSKNRRMQNRLATFMLDKVTCLTCQRTQTFQDRKKATREVRHVINNAIKKAIERGL